jgi:hypothetical protein
LLSSKALLVLKVLKLEGVLLCVLVVLRVGRVDLLFMVDDYIYDDLLVDLIYVGVVLDMTFLVLDYCFWLTGVVVF